VVIATLVSLVGSLAVDAALVSIGKRIFPSTSGYVHFRFPDYGKLTVIARISSAPQWLFFRMAVLVTLVLWLPDLILHQGQSGQAVVVLMAMHLAIALVTYNALVGLVLPSPPAPARVGSVVTTS
jgi:hypothetical protein